MKKKVISLLLAVALILASTVIASAEAIPFRDVPSSQWYYGAVVFCYNNGYMTGDSATAFKPNGTVTRAQVAQVLYNLKANRDPATAAINAMPFQDVPKNQWYAKAVAWCWANGVTSGTSATTFEPNAPVTREQLAVLFYNAEGAPSASQIKASRYNDWSRVSSWARNGVAWAINSGLISGTGNNTIDPRATAPRCQLAQILMNFTRKGNDTDTEGEGEGESEGSDPDPDPDPDPSTTPDPSPSPSEPPVTPTPTPTPTPDADATVWGFSLPVWSSKMVTKISENDDKRGTDGSHIYSARFCSNGGIGWIDGVTFKVEDVTPTAYKNMYQTMGKSAEITQIVKESAAALRSEKILEPLDDSKDTPVKRDVSAVSAVDLTVTADIGVRALKVSAVKDKAVLDTVYIMASPYAHGSYNEYCPQDLELYQRVREIIESHLWTAAMTSAEKLGAIAGYINTTAHYPGKLITTEEYNPTLWRDWSVDGIDLYYNMNGGDPILSRTMALQGGIITCRAASLLEWVATEDLGMEYLYVNGELKETGEGVWIGMGSYSTNPSVPTHTTLWYRDASGKTYAYDAQGMEFNDPAKAACEGHGCKEKIIPLK